MAGCYFFKWSLHYNCIDKVIIKLGLSIVINPTLKSIILYLTISQESAKDKF